MVNDEDFIIQSRHSGHNSSFCVLQSSDQVNAVT